MKNSAKLADRLHQCAIKHGYADDTWNVLRDYVDGATNGDLDCFELDMCTDMVFSRIAKAKGEKVSDFHRKRTPYLLKPEKDYEHG